MIQHVDHTVTLGVIILPDFTDALFPTQVPYGKSIVIVLVFADWVRVDIPFRPTVGL